MPHRQLKLRRLMIAVRSMTTVIEELKDVSEDMDLMKIYLYMSLGELQDRPFDVTDLSDAAGISRATVTRKLTKMEQEGQIKWSKIGNRRIPVHADKSLWRQRLDEFGPMLARALRRTVL